MKGMALQQPSWTMRHHTKDDETERQKDSGSLLIPESNPVTLMILNFDIFYNVYKSMLKPELPALRVHILKNCSRLFGHYHL